MYCHAFFYLIFFCTFVISGKNSGVSCILINVTSCCTNLVCLPEMPSDIERKCCGQLPDFCISILPHMDLYILEEGVLRLARRIWNDIRAVQDLPDLGENHRQFRHTAYRQFVVWQYGALGHGHRVVIPSCCVWKIHDRFPDPQGQYTGYNPGRV
uniref:P2X purinoreceptor 7 intracellular domain-containing protein n=1 Tax=Sinocyclocheilus anshuiensis TaxID=1608454 RepID=A0A671M451_9TELE